MASKPVVVGPTRGHTAPGPRGPPALPLWLETGPAQTPLVMRQKASRGQHVAPGTSSPGLGKLSKVIKNSRRNKASTQQLCAGSRVGCSSPRAKMQSLPSSGSMLCTLRPSRLAGVPAKTLEHTVLTLPRAPRLWDEGVTGTSQPACQQTGTKLSEQGFQEWASHFDP